MKMLTNTLKNLFDYCLKLFYFEIQGFQKDSRKEAWNKSYKVTFPDYNEQHYLPLAKKCSAFVRNKRFFVCV